MLCYRWRFHMLGNGRLLQRKQRKPYPSTSVFARCLPQLLIRDNRASKSASAAPPSTTTSILLPERGSASHAPSKLQGFSFERVGLQWKQGVGRSMDGWHEWSLAWLSSTSRARWHMRGLRCHASRSVTHLISNANASRSVIHFWLLSR